MTDKSQAMIDELVAACIAFGRQVEPDWQTRIETARRELREYIAELEAAQRWHVVGDGDLPIAGKSIMFYDSSSEEIYRGVYTASHHWRANYFSEKCETVTHWLPLPEPPEDTNNEPA